MALTRIENNQISNAIAGNSEVGINGNAKIQQFTVTGLQLANSIVYGSNFTANGNITGGNLFTGGTISSTSTITGGNIATTGYVSATSNITGGNIFTAGEVSASGNITGEFILGNITFANGFNSNTIFNGTSNVLIASANGNVTISVDGVSDVVTVTSSGLQTNNITTSGNAIIGGDLVVNGNLAYVNVTDLNVEDPIIGLGRGPNNAALTADDGKDRGEQLWYYADGEKSAFTGYDNSAGKIIVATDVTVTNEIVAVNNYGGFVAGNIESATVSSTGTVTAGNLATGGTVSATGTATVGNLATAGTVSATGDVTGGNILTAGDVSATGTGTFGNVATAGTVSATGNITGANIFGANIYTTGVVSATGTGTFGNVATAGTVSATGTIQGGNILTAGDVSATGSLTGGNIFTGGTVSAVSTITGGNIATAGTVSATGTVTGGNIATAGTVSATGDVTGGNINTAGNVSATGAVIADSGFFGNIDLTGNITVNSLTSNTFISASGTITGGNLATAGTVSATGDITGGNIATAGTVSATGNITGDYFFGNGSQLTGIDTNLIKNGDSNVRILTANGNISMDVDGTSNVVVVTQSGIDITGALTTSGTANVGNLETTGSVSAVGNVTGGNVNTGSLFSSGELTITANASGILFSTAGNINVGNIHINNLADPLQAQDAATKAYVDAVAEGLVIDAPAAAATPDTLAIITGGTVTYDNGNAGVGATLVTTGSYTLIDGVDVTIVGTRILVKDEANLAHNGIYTYANSTAIVRSTDFDQPSEIGGHEFVFVEFGNIYAGAGFVNIDNVTTVGTDPVEWIQFSGAGTIQAGNGIAVNGTQVNVLTDGITTGINGSNQVEVIPNAQLTTPNIGEATGTSVSLTGNVQAGNLFTGGAVSATGDLTGGNVSTGGFVSATGNISGGNVLTGGLISATGTITSADTISGGNLATSGTITATGTATVGNLATAGSVTATGTVTGGNIATAGTVSATGNITGDYFFGNGSQLTGIDTTLISNGNSNVQVYANSNVAVTIAGTANTAVFTTDGLELTGNVFAGQAVFGTSFTPVTGATVTINATDSVLMPVGNTDQRPGTPATGMLRFNTTLDKLEVYDSDSWEEVGATIFTVIGDDQFAGDGSTVTFTLSSSQTTNSCIVSINGVVQIPGTAYTVSGTALTFSEAPQPGDDIDVRQITTTTTVVGISNSPANASISVNDASNVITVTGDLQGTGNALTIIGDLTITGNATISGNVATNQISNGTSAVQIPTTNGNVNIDVGAADDMAVFTTTGLFITGNINATGDVTAQNVNSLSDATLKTNVEPIENAGAVVDALNGVGYDWVDGSGHAYGMLAQEVEEIIPEAVKTDANGIKSVNYQMVIPFLIETVKQLRQDIAEIKSQLKK